MWYICGVLSVSGIVCSVCGVYPVWCMCGVCMCIIGVVCFMCVV